MDILVRLLFLLICISVICHENVNLPVTLLKLRSLSGRSTVSQTNNNYLIRELCNVIVDVLTQTLATYFGPMNLRLLAVVNENEIS